MFSRSKDRVRRIVMKMRSIFVIRWTILIKTDDEKEDKREEDEMKDGGIMNKIR